MSVPNHITDSMNHRSREVFRHLVEAYLKHGAPIGSATLTSQMAEQISPATIRNVMQDLEGLGLLDAPHISAGRIPTHLGLRLFVDGFMEIGNLQTDLQKEIKTTLQDPEDLPDLSNQVGNLLSNLTQSASLVVTAKSESPIKHIELVSLSPNTALAVLVTEEGQVENRLFDLPKGTMPSTLSEASNFLSTVLAGATLSQMQTRLQAQIKKHNADLDVLTKRLINEGVAHWAGGMNNEDRLVIRGRSNLLGEAGNEQDMARVKQLFDDLEQKKGMGEFLDLIKDGDGVRIFIGAENKLFSLSGSSLIISSYKDKNNTIIGAVGVIGPTRLNYGRIVPIVDYTAQLIGDIVRCK